MKETGETISSIASALAGINAVSLLTVVLSLIGGAVAAYLVSWRETRIRREEEDRRRDEERKGLLLLIEYEIRGNTSGARAFDVLRQQLEEVRERYLKENEESNLADAETFDKFFDRMVVSLLVSYYSGIPIFNDVVQRGDLRKKETLDYLVTLQRLS